MLASVWHQHRIRFFVLSFISAADGEGTFEIRGYPAIGFMRLIEQLIQNVEKTTELLMQLKSNEKKVTQPIQPCQMKSPDKLKICI
jgi:hypothetical protein